MRLEDIHKVVLTTCVGKVREMSALLSIAKYVIDLKSRNLKLETKNYGIAHER